MKPRLAGLPAAYRRHPAPALVVLSLTIIAITVIVIGSMYAVRSRGDRFHPDRVETSQPVPSVSTIPTGYATGDPIPPANETGLQTGDTG